jgi:hypothetical protein
MPTTNRTEELKMNEGLKCDSCGADAAYVVVEPTDATARGTLYCAKCSTATSAGFAPIHYADEAEGETLTGGEYVEYEGTIGVVSNRGGTIGRYSLRMPLGEVTTLRRSDFRVLFAEPQDEEPYGRCETCGEPIDYCQGHGEIAEAVASGRPVYPEAGAPVPEEIRALGDDEPNRTQKYAMKIADRERERAGEALRKLIREGRLHLELLEAGRVRTLDASHLNRQVFDDAERALVRWSLAAEIASRPDVTI